MSTDREGVQGWRDLIDALTPSQVAYLERWEAHPEEPPMADGSAQPPERHRQGLLFAAREMVGSNAAGALFADVAPPAEDGEHYPWMADGDGTWTRYFVGTTRQAGEIAVTIHGHQYSDGAISRGIMTDDADELDATSARQLAAMLLAAADELERLR